MTYLNLPSLDFEEDIFFEDDVDPVQAMFDVLDRQRTGNPAAVGCTCGGPYCARCGCCACQACPGGCVWATAALCSGCVE